MLLIATICGVFYYVLSKHGLAAEERKNPQSRRRVSLLTETVAYIGVLLVLAGVGVAAGQSWSDLTGWGPAAFFGSIALFFLAIGLIVLLVADLPIQRMLGVMWFLSASFAGAAAGIVAHDVYGTSGTNAPWVAFALGLWALGIGWSIVGWVYPQPLGTTVPLGVAIALIGPSFAVWDHPWV